ncbi:helix-turn-helix domain-containing protein [Carnobacterium mobile]|uniref:helix-turn-helix domain-containing protein n=1 Tax=Carnobacterium mobile TaxID=2750 RepID=UPI000555DB3A|nr:helix-turn-helix transcriptional regulator [Carnobacterium mobile]
MEISHEIKKRRTELNITQEELAERLNVTRAAVSNWEVGRNYPDIQLLLKISDELNISLDQLLRGDKTMVSSIDKKN